MQTANIIDFPFKISDWIVFGCMSRVLSILNIIVQFSIELSPEQSDQDFVVHRLPFIVLNVSDDMPIKTI